MKVWELESKLEKGWQRRLVRSHVAHIGRLLEQILMALYGVRYGEREKEEKILKVRLERLTRILNKDLRKLTHGRVEGTLKEALMETNRGAAEELLKTVEKLKEGPIDPNGIEEHASLLRRILSWVRGL